MRSFLAALVVSSGLISGCSFDSVVGLVDPYRIDVRQGDAVQAGTPIGVQGNTGDSTGPHLHFQVEVNGSPVDPRAWLTQAGIDIPRKSNIKQGYL